MNMGASLAEELGAALDGVELPAGEGVAETTVDTGTESAPVESTGTGRDEHGRFIGKTAEADPAAPVAQDQAAVDPAKPADPAAAVDPQAQADARAAAVPPATWSAGAKAIYASLPEIARKEIAKRETDYARGIQQYAEKAKVADSFMREAQPYEAMLRAEGSNPVAALSAFLQQAYTLRSATPQERGRLIMETAQKFGADLSPYLGQQAEQPGGQTQDLSQVQALVQQLVAPHLRKIQQWENSQATAQQHQEQQMEQEIYSQITAFQSATNEDGSPKHLYFENVRPLMSAFFANGQAKDLEQAYDMACFANPEVRAALQADMQRSADAQRLEEAKRKTGQARSASFNPTGQGGIGIAGATQSSLRDELAAQIDAATGGGRF
jgi:hypothetical protein